MPYALSGSERRRHRRARPGKVTVVLPSFRSLARPEYSRTAFDVDDQDGGNLRRRSSRSCVSDPSKRPLYDQRTHPMDQELNLQRWNAHLKREGLLALPKIASNDQSDDSSGDDFGDGAPSAYLESNDEESAPRSVEGSSYNS